MWFKYQHISTFDKAMAIFCVFNICKRDQKDILMAAKHTEKSRCKTMVGWRIWMCEGILRSEDDFGLDVCGVLADDSSEHGNWRVGVQIQGHFKDSGIADLLYEGNEGMTASINSNQKSRSDPNNGKYYIKFEDIPLQGTREVITQHSIMEHNAVCL